MSAVRMKKSKLSGEEQIMNIAYCSILLPEEKKIAERTKAKLSGISLHKFTRAVISGLDANLDTPVKVFNIINTVNYPKFPQLIFRTERWHHVPQSDDWHIGYINLFGIKYITQCAGLYKKLCSWVMSLNGEPCLICVHNIYLPAMQAAFMVRKKIGDRVKLCLITGDMNGKYGLPSQNKANLKQFLLKGVNRRIDKLATKFDSFVFATEPMADAFGVQDKPHVVVECAYLAPEYSSIDKDARPESGKKIIFYAGSVRKEYGIPHLLNAFELIRDDDYELRLAGDGNCADLVKEYAAKDKRIKFLGFITPQEVDKNQNEATILISPRIATGHEFVKYSFPSKTMESLASGKPYIAHRLPCDPPEYADYIQYAEDESDESLKEKIVEICELSDSERDDIGKRALDFINREKNPVVMTKRIIEMWEDDLNEK